MKKKKSDNNSGGYQICRATVLYDDIHNLMETELLDLEQIEMYMIAYKKNNKKIPDCLINIHKDKVDNIYNLLSQRLHSDK